MERNRVYVKNSGLTHNEARNPVSTVDLWLPNQRFFGETGFL
ncbi:hypothetical protein ACE1CM_21065 [Microseira sp. BLCC-F43]